MKIAPLKRMVDASRPITYGIVQAGEDVVDGIPYVRPIDMVPFARTLERSALRTTSLGIAASYRRSTIQPGDLVVSIGPSYGKLLVVPPELAGANLTQGTARVAPARGVDVNYLQWMLASPEVRAFWSAAVGGATFGGLNLGPLAMTPVPVRSPRAQTAIVEFLDRECARIDELLLEVDASHATGAAAFWARSAPVLLDGGKLIRLKHLTGRPKNGSWGSPPDETVHRVRCFRVTDFDRDRLALSGPGATRGYGASEVRGLALDVGDLILEKSGGGTNNPVGFVVKCGESARGQVCSNFVARIRPSPGVASEWLTLVFGALYALGRNRPFVKQVTGIQNLDTEGYLSLRVPDIGLDEQRAIARQIAAGLDTSLRLRSELEGLRSGLVAYRAALVSEVASGKLDVTKRDESLLQESLAAVREGERPEVLPS